MPSLSPRLILPGLLLLVVLIAGLGANWDRRQLLANFASMSHECQPFQPAWLGELRAQIRRMKLPGAQIAYVSPSGQLVQCTVGWSRHWPWPRTITSEDRFRFASLSKVFASIAALQLQEEGRWRLDERLVESVNLSGGLTDERVQEITLGHLLRHTGGFDRLRSGDPMLSPAPWCPHRLERLVQFTLDSQPGERYAYSNLGYCLLGAALERATRQPLENLLRARILAPLGLERVAPLVQGRRLNDEVGDYPSPDESLSSVTDIPYAHLMAVGAWSGTAADFAHVLRAAVTGRLLGDRGRASLLAVDEGCDIGRWRACHGYAFYPYRREGGQRMYWRDGSLPGTTAFAAVLEDGSAFVLLGNSRDLDWGAGTDRLGQKVYAVLAAKE